MKQYFFLKKMRSAVNKIQSGVKRFWLTSVLFSLIIGHAYYEIQKKCEKKLSMFHHRHAFQQQHRDKEVIDRYFFSLYKRYRWCLLWNTEREGAKDCLYFIVHICFVNEAESKIWHSYFLYIPIIGKIQHVYEEQTFSLCNRFP